MRKDLWTIPNLVSYARFALLPVFVWAHLTGRAWAALILFAVAMGSDFIDGLLARLLDQRSELGALMDPIADKLFVTTALVLLVVVGAIPWWLLGLVVIRDGFLGLTAMRVKRRKLTVKVQPSRIGKYATFTLTCVVILALFGQSDRAPELLHAYTVVFAFVAGLCVIISSGQYFARYGYLLTARA
jgi:cardiolipin synthase